MIYFVRHGESVKIGFSKTPWRRIQQMQTGFPLRLEILLVIEGDEEGEHALHARFHAQRQRGEWFALEGPIERFIAEQQRAGVGVSPPGSDRGVQAKIVRATGLSSAYVCQLMSGARDGNLTMAVRIYRAAGVRIPLIEGATEDEIAVLEKFVLRRQSAKVDAA